VGDSDWRLRDMLALRQPRACVQWRLGVVISVVGANVDMDLRRVVCAHLRGLGYMG